MKRQDAYGGDLNGRMRFALELIKKRFATAGQKTGRCSFRVSCVDGKGGAPGTSRMRVALARELKEPWR